MKKSDRKVMHWSHYLVSIIGIAYAVVKYFMGAADELGVYPHPSLPLYQYAHIISVPLLVFAFGFIFQSHIQAKINSNAKANWVSGYILIITFGLMVFSGYFLQTAISGKNREICLIVHLVLSGLWCISYTYHHIKGRKIIP